MKDIKPLIFAAGLFTLAWLGYVEGLTGAQNIVTFVTIALGVIFAVGELAQLIADLIEALGGEREEQGAA